MKTLTTLTHHCRRFLSLALLLGTLLLTTGGVAASGVADPSGIAHIFVCANGACGS
jgi:hypothetical protein